MDQRLVGGRYRLHEARAMGGTASIWRATDERTGEVVAVKRLHPHLAASDDARARLDREGAALRAIVHPNVVTVRAVVVDDSGPAVVMDYVEGASLAERLAGGGPLAEDRALGIALDVTEALRAVHAVGLVHRDVKPGNILLGDDGRTRLIDFGIAADIEAVAETTALTATDDVIGTLRYLAPERLAGEPATPSTDLWGVGAVLYEMLTGRPAYPSATIVDRVSDTVATPARPDGIGDATWAIIERAMAMDPAARPADAGELAQAIRDRLAGPAAPVAPVGDPWADTMSIAVPIAAISAAREHRHPTAAVSGPSAAPGFRRTGVLAGLGAAGLAAVIIVAMSQAGSAPVGVDVARPTAAPVVAPSARPDGTAQPTVAADPVEAAEPGSAGNGKDKDNGKGRGNGKGD